MIKFKLRRKMSGNKIRKAKRKIEFDPNKKYENKNAYSRNRIQRRHVENPNLQEGEKPLRPGIPNIRLPRKCRKTAWKRFRKHFPYIKVKNGKITWNLQIQKEFYDSSGSKKKS